MRGGDRAANDRCWIFSTFLMGLNEKKKIPMFEFLVRSHANCLTINLVIDRNWIELLHFWCTWEQSLLLI